MRPGLLGIGVLALVVAGCSGPDAEPTALPASTTTVAQPDFDPCADFPQSVLKSEGLMLLGPEDWERDGAKAHGCSYAVTESGYNVRIVRTTRTLADIRQRFPDSYREQKFGTRTGAFYALFPEQGSKSCVVNLEMKTGSLQFDLSNPPSGRTTGHLNSCDLVTNLVDKVLPSMPEGA
ncbi:DUF3558 domain-containing protein [Nocardia sp. NPDC058480]|uniref:DUF3558 domain-containing protein n=1 Tax=Nocardia sp. NPDC058480 TaxID=3346522 RepID=UPI00364B3994